MTERYKETRRRASDAVILLHSGVRYYCYGRDITIVREALSDRVFSTSRDAEGREVYHFDRVNLSEVMCAVIRAGHRVIIVEEDMEVVADIANNDSNCGNAPGREMEGLFKAKEHAIGERFEIDHIIYEVRPARTCQGCSLYIEDENECLDRHGRFEYCVSNKRKDGQDVKFVQVGEANA